MQLALLSAWTLREMPCGCVMRGRPGGMGWLGHTVKACPTKAAGKSCAAVRGEG